MALSPALLMFQFIRHLSDQKVRQTGDFPETSAEPAWSLGAPDLWTGVLVQPARVVQLFTDRAQSKKAVSGRLSGPSLSNAECGPARWRGFSIQASSRVCS